MWLHNCAGEANSGRSPEGILRFLLNETQYHEMHLMVLNPSSEHNVRVP